jgi:hypothetical protein
MQIVQTVLLPQQQQPTSAQWLLLQCKLCKLC